MEKISYAILMTKKVLEVGIYYYSPELLIEGEMFSEEDKNFFIDTLGNEYLTIHDPEITFSDLERAIGYVISKEDLLKKFPGVSLEQAKALYFEAICESSHFGFYIYQENVIGVIPLNLKDISAKLNSMEISPEDNVIELAMSDIAQPQCNESGHPLSEAEKENIQEQIECIYMDIRLFEDILASKTYEEVMNKLKQIYPKQINQQTYQNGADILNKFDQTYDAFVKIESIDEIKAMIKELEDYYIELSVKIDELSKTRNTEAASKFIYTLVDAYDNLLKIDDLEQIRKGILTIRDNSRKNLERIANAYDVNVQRENVFTSVEPEMVKEEEKEASEQIIDVKTMKSYFDQIIIGQDEAKKDVIAAIVMNKLADDPRSKNSCLLVGPTGSGKTLIAETVSKYFDMPMEIVDTTQLTMPGYVGANIEDFLVRLLHKAGGGGY